MRATVVYCQDVFRPSNRRRVATVRAKRTLNDLRPASKLPVICQVNGEWISQKEWNYRIQDGDNVAFLQLPQGDGGGGSMVLKIVIMIAIIYFAPYAANFLGGSGWVAAAEGTFAATGIGTAVTAAIGITGAVLVNLLIPPPKPTFGQLQTTSMDTASPTYSLNSQQNSARLGAPIPVIYGRHLIYPDLAARPYVEYSGNEQYLYQLMTVGQGEYDIEDIRIEDTPINSFEEITYQIVKPGEQITAFPTNVITSIEVSGQEAEYNTYLGPFVASDAGETSNFIGIDVVMPRGLYYANDSGGLDSRTINWRVEVRAIDNSGNPVDGIWVTIGTETFTAATTTPQRLSKKYGVGSGRYEVRLMRTNTKDSSSRAGHELVWAGLRAYLVDGKTYPTLTLVAMRMRASNNLSQAASRKINMMVTRKLHKWSSVTGWNPNPETTRSIAWALADVCRQEYGANLVDNRIDLATLEQLDAVWNARGDYFDGIFDSPSTIMESLNQIARAGRAIPFIQGGIIRVVRDQLETIPVALFSQRNIVKNSLNIDYLMPSEETSDAVDVTYFDKTIWSDQTVRAMLPGSQQKSVAQVKLFGVTEREQAWREGMYMAACNRYRRRVITFTTEMEGFIPTLGDLVAIQHDMPKWGQSGEAVAFNPTTKTLTTNEPLVWTGVEPHKIALRNRDGSVAGPYNAIQGGTAYEVVLSDWVSGTDPVPYVGDQAERTHYAFGIANAQYIKCRITNIKPKSTETVEIVCVTESDYVHNADTGTSPTPSSWQLPTKYTSPVITGLTAASMFDSVDKMVLSWQPAAGAEYYIVEQSGGDGNWIRVGEVTSANYSAIALYGAQTMVRVAAVGLTRGPWQEISYGITSAYFWMNNTDPFWTTDSNLMWRY